MSNLHRGIVLLTALLFFLLAIGCASSHRAWVGTWTASPAPPPQGYADFQNQTLREIVHVSVGGTAIGVTLSNLFGTAPLVIGEAHVATRSSGSSIAPASDRALTFANSSSCTIPPGEFRTSDTVQMQVSPLTDLAVSLYLPQGASNPTIHPVALETTYVGEGNRAGEVNFAANSTIISWPFLTNVQVFRDESNSAIAALGDSITDGFNSTLNANHRWTDVLARRLISTNGTAPAVLNAGLSGNRLLHDAPEDSPWYGPSALTRFDRDVLNQVGVKYVIVLEGINDIGLPGYLAPTSEEVTPTQITTGLQQLIELAHARGVRIYGGTLTPFEGALFPGYYSAAKETVRETVNQWIRSSNSFDAVIDFDAVLRDPSRQTRLLPLYDSGDHLHPNDAGYNAMGDAVELGLFQ